MQWSWCYTIGEKMISDLQGVADNRNYTLTDPAILSLTDKYGVTDTGVEGMVKSFFKHT